MTKARRALVKALTGILLLAGLITSDPASAADRIVPGHRPYPTGGTTAVGAGIDLANQNAQLADNLPASIKRSWRASPPLCPQSGGSGATSISVTREITVVNDIQYQCSWVSAYKTSTGELVWRRPYHRTRRAVVVGSAVYVQHDNGSSGDLVDALDLATGKRRWSSEYGGEGYSNDYAPAVGAGLVMSSIWASDARSGKSRLTLATDELRTQEQGSTVIVGGRIYVNASDNVTAYDAKTGARIWLRRKSVDTASQSGNQRPAVHAGRVYITGYKATLVYNAKTGRQYRTLPASDHPIAFDGDVGFFTANRWATWDPSKSNTVTAVNLATGNTYWTHRLTSQQGGPAATVTAPVVSNGLVWIQEGTDTLTKAQLVALDEVTGKKRSSIVQACAPLASQYATITIAQHRIFTSSDCGVLTYVRK